MSNDRLILCGGMRQPNGFDGMKSVRLNLWDGQGNINFQISDVSKPTVANIPPLLIDLMEIAAYVYCADQAETRGGNGVQNVGEKWRRSFQFHVPVREPEIWSSSEINELLCNTLSDLSDDNYQFTFHKLNNPPPIDSYFNFDAGGGSGITPQSVIMFSGGLDSLAGAVKEAVAEKNSVVLVSHRSSPKLAGKMKSLVSEMGSQCSVRPLHIPVWVNKSKKLGKEYTQRTRSFLYASLGAVVARIFDLWEIKFYENGVISLNLPISEQVIGARATRTTHPMVLDGFAELFTRLFKKPFKVSNPFIWKTKGEIIRLIMDGSCGGLIKHSVSCTHTWEMTKMHTHCGRCSQCVDRRFAALASGAVELDPAEMYGVDLLTGKREEGIDRTLVESYIRRATEIKKMNDDGIEFFSRYSELTRVIGKLKDHGNADEISSKIFGLYRRHAQEVCGVVDKAIGDYAPDLREGKLAETCAIALVLPEKYRQVIKSNDTVFPKFPTPSNAEWADIKMKFVDDYNLSVTLREIKNKRVSCDEMQMMDRRNSKFNKQWELLRIFADGHGTLTWDHSGADRKNQKQREELAKKLQTFFDIKSDPIEYVQSTKGWKTRFEIEPDQSAN